jgi:hypothetical protein
MYTSMINGRDIIHKFNHAVSVFHEHRRRGCKVVTLYEVNDKCNFISYNQGYIELTKKCHGPSALWLILDSDVCIWRDYLVESGQISV